MKSLTKRKCELFVYNLKLIEEGLKETDIPVSRILSAAYSSNSLIFDTKRVLRCVGYIKNLLASSKSTAFIATRMSLNGQLSANKISDVYLELRKRLKYRSPEYYIQYTACILSEYADMDSARAAHITTKQFENIRIKKRRAGSCDSDLITSSLFAVHDPLHRDDISEDIAECIKELEIRNVSVATAKYVARILAFGKGVASARCDRFIRLCELLKDRDAKTGDVKEMAAVALAALIDIPDNDLVDAIAEVNNYFAQNLEMKEPKRVMYSALVACDDIISRLEDESLLLIKEAALAVILSSELSNGRR